MNSVTVTKLACVNIIKNSVLSKQITVVESHDILTEIIINTHPHQYQKLTNCVKTVHFSIT